MSTVEEVMGAGEVQVAMKAGEWTEVGMVGEVTEGAESVAEARRVTRAVTRAVAGAGTRAVANSVGAVRGVATMAALQGSKTRKAARP